MLCSPLVRRQQQLEKNVEEFREFSRTISDQIADLQSRMGCVTNKTNSRKVWHTGNLEVKC